MIEYTTDFYQKSEKEMDDFVRFPITFSDFPWNSILLTMAKKIFS